MGWGNMPPKLQRGFWAFVLPVWGFPKKKFKDSIRYFISHRKASTHFCHLTPHFPQKWSCVPKIIFRSYFGKYCFFFSKKLLNEENSKSHFLQKGHIDFCRQRSPSPQNCHIYIWFITISSESTEFLK